MKKIMMTHTKVSQPGKAMSREKGMSGINMLLTVGAIVATLAGWAGLTKGQQTVIPTDMSSGTIVNVPTPDPALRFVRKSDVPAAPRQMERKPRPTPVTMTRSSR
ncbi:MAG: hypothetical protein GFH27_549361n6 [Chloroflexi bacterium AL-W]|nr:hypothetical protein [Chloroflexi bacterium AL-N1]NOK70718.1 hypothetical protein [Chloroflexi bacterium AL-N10]NOK78278.1 hypothetical protein [Chloroflexi bacterium AL-N5]NOK85621.1 hypothetical protein [Chloroflexi bacterium AL-W]NOK92535.1 hypothetical protein [Chloroflexi bacterium AL-N15]